MADGLTLGATIGTYVVGELITFTLTHSTGGSINVRGSRFSGMVPQQTTPTTRRWIISQGNSTLSQGIFVKSVTPRPLTSVKNESTSPKNYSLRQNYPNPFNPSTTIEYQLPSRGNVQINICNSLGQLVRSLVNELRDAGTHSVVWDGRDNGGHAVSTGAYFYQVQVGGFVQAKRMLLLK